MPCHPCTEALLFAVLIVDSKIEKRRVTMNSVLPDQPPLSACAAFENHCIGRTGIFCDEEVPFKHTLAGDRGVTCHLLPDKLEVVEPAIAIKSVVH